ncbi:MAG: beta-ketoacyl-[acyl-carrier-protein] synthase family protein [Paracoccaceae bacterium]
MQTCRVVITGAGTVNPLAQDVPGTFAALQRGQCAIGPLHLQDADRLQIRIGAQVTEWDEGRFGRDLALYDRVTQFAMIAADQAMAQAGVAANHDPTRRGVILGTAGGGLSTVEANYRAVFADGKNRVHPLTVPRLMASAPASHIAMRHGAQGPVFAVASACASANHAMGLALQMIRAGLADSVLTGGADAMLTFGGIKAWEGLRVLSPDGCRPFCATRNGLVMGEGAAVFVFEAREHALARGATVLAEVAGFGMTSDASDIVLPSAEGAARAIRLALSDAGLAAQDIGYVNAHGTGTAANDRIESAVIAQELGADVPVSSTKSMHGHLIGGTGAVELLACLMALQDGIIAPTIGYHEQDPDCAINLVQNKGLHAPVTATLSNAFAFGGLNAVIALTKAESRP